MILYDFYIGNVKVLDLSLNSIVSLDGIDRLYSLQQVNLSSNLINDFQEISYLSKLPCLESIDLSNNPFSLNMTRQTYRLQVFTQFIKEADNGIKGGGALDAYRPIPKLDGEDMTAEENEVFK